MSRRNLSVAMVVVAVAGWALPASGYYFDIWEVSADGSMGMYSPDGGYANAGSAGQFILSKAYSHMGYMAFNGPSDGPDKQPPGRLGDGGDGVLLANWLVGKKAFGATLYFRNAAVQTCDPAGLPGAYLNDPVTILGFRCANEGEFIDQDHAQAGTAASYYNPSVGPGDVAAPAWRMGQYLAMPPRSYDQQGAIGGNGEFWKVSARDSRWPELQVKVDNLAGSSFRTPGFEGYSGYSNRFAFGWMVDSSDAHLVNSGAIGTADCSGPTGSDQPRDMGLDLPYMEGWFAKHIDRRIVQALATPDYSTGVIECKGLVFYSPTPGGTNSYVFSREGCGGNFAPYLAITATIQGDANNDGCVDVEDLLWIVPYFGSIVPPDEPDLDIDFNCDGYIDAVDLLTLVENFGLCAE